MRCLIKGPKLSRLLNELEDAPKGDVVELGVYCGGSLIALAETAPDRLCFGFDTFTGLPEEAWSEGEPHGVGDFGDTSFEAVQAATSGLGNVILIQGLFPESTSGWIGSPIALAHVDFDFYESTKAAINWLLPRMVKGGVIVFDDYDWEHCPGVRKAIEEAGLIVENVGHNQAIYRH